MIRFAPLVVICLAGSAPWASANDKAAWREPAGKNLRIPDLALDLIWIAPGAFAMGSENGSPDEKPVLRVTLSQGFWMGRTEVTQAQWQTVMGNNPAHFKGADRPVELVSWPEAMEFCRKLTEHERRAGRLPPRHEYTLPTEAQWEYACRAGTTGDHAGTPADVAWLKGTAKDQTHPVAQKQPNAWGLHDMHGNVWEWCLDWYDEKSYGMYKNANVTDPTGPAAGTLRVSRGGSWFSTAPFCRSADRNWNSPGRRDYVLGFRVVLVGAAE